MLVLAQGTLTILKHVYKIKNNMYNIAQETFSFIHYGISQSLLSVFLHVGTWGLNKQTSLKGLIKFLHQGSGIGLDTISNGTLLMV